MTKFGFLFAAVFAFVPTISLSAESGVISRDEIRASFSTLADDEGAKDFSVDLGKGKLAPVHMEVTRQGNGTLSILNLNLRLYDEHDDSAVYKTGSLDIDGVDLNDDGRIDLVVSGIVLHTGEKETDPKTEESVVFVYVQDSSGSKFNRAYKKGSIEVAI